MGGELTVSSPRAWAVFHVKLFLPEVHGDALGKAAAPAALAAHERQHQRQRRATRASAAASWWWTTKSPTASCWCSCWNPGLWLRQAASGHDALDLLATGYRPHVIFMDLAMPGIDGWGNAAARAADAPAPRAMCHRFRQWFRQAGSTTTWDIRPKTSSSSRAHSELLDWLERRLGLQWL